MSIINQKPRFGYDTEANDIYDYELNKHVPLSDANNGTDGVWNLFEVKRPEESKGPFDYYKLLQTTPADEAFRPLAEGGCGFLKS